MQLAFVTPLNPRTTGVADYSLELLPALARAARNEIQVFSQEDDVSPQNPGQGWRRRRIADLPRSASEFDLIIYQMGNSEAHDFMAPYLFRYPGLVVLHDLSLHNFYARQVEAGHPDIYLRSFGFGYGLSGMAAARRYLQTHMSIGYPEFLLSEWLAARSLGIIVHSHHAATLLSERCPTARIEVVPQLMPVLPDIPLEVARARLGIAQDTYLMAVFGVLNLSKYPLATLDALSRLRADGIPAKAVFIGRENASFQLAPEVARRNLQDAVIHLGYIDLKDVNSWVSAADVCVALRQFYFGETSSALLRVLATGRPAVVTAIGAFAELPDEVCSKVAADDPDVIQSVYFALKHLYIDTQRRQIMGKAARAYVMHELDPDRIAARYVALAQSIISGVEMTVARRNFVA
jgi:glycosyltransferase involved in cell wall biosynthesis